MVEVRKDSEYGEYFVAIKTDKLELLYDKEITEYIGISDKEYKGVLTGRFRGYVEQNEVCFKEKEQAERAADWVRENMAYFLMNKNNKE